MLTLVDVFAAQYTDIMIDLDDILTVNSLLNVIAKIPTYKQVLYRDGKIGNSQKI